MVKTKYIIIALAIIALLLFAWWLSRRKNITFDFNLGGNLGDLLGSIQRNTQAGQKLGFYVDVPLTTTISNKGAAATVLNNLTGSLLYNGVAIVQTKPSSQALQSVSIPAKSSTKVTDNVNLLVNEQSIKLISDLVQGKKPVITYNLGTTILGKAYTFSNASKINNAGSNSLQRIQEELFDAGGNPIMASSQKQKACCASCLEYSHTLSFAVGNLPAGSKVYTCNKACSCGTF